MVSDIAMAPPEVVRRATRNLAAALAATPEFTAYEQAATAFRQDYEAAKQAIAASLHDVNRDLSQHLGVDFATLARRSGCC